MGIKKVQSMTAYVEQTAQMLRKEVAALKKQKFQQSPEDGSLANKIEQVAKLLRSKT